MLKALKNKNVIFALLGSVLSLAGVLIYNLLPFSEIANGIQYSATDALWVLALSPALLFLGGVSFIFAFFKDKKNWEGTLPDAAIYSFTAIFTAAVIINFAVSLSYFISQYDLGFVAPFTGLVYETFAVVMIIFAIWQFLFTALTVAECAREIK